MSYTKANAIIDHMNGVSINEIADKLELSPKTVSNWFVSKGLYRCKNYSEMEEYLLLNFSAKHCAQFIKNKSINALKIKKCRLIKSLSNSQPR